MDITALNYLNIVENDTENVLTVYKDLARSASTITQHCVSLSLDSSAFLKKIKILASNATDTELDGDLQFIASIERLKESNKAIAKDMESSINFFFCRLMLHKAAKNYESIIDIVVKHDAVVLGIPTTELGADELMIALNNPANKAVLDKSIAQFRSGKGIGRSLIL